LVFLDSIWLSTTEGGVPQPAASAGRGLLAQATSDLDRTTNHDDPEEPDGRGTPALCSITPMPVTEAPEAQKTGRQSCHPPPLAGAGYALDMSEQGSGSRHRSMQGCSEAVARRVQPWIG
jgi:hypothetical protein